jgi:transposase
MEKIDGRRFPISTQEERRRIAVKMKDQGSTLKEIHQALGMSPSTICRAWKAYMEGGKKALKNGIRGRKKGERRHLSLVQENIIRKKIIDHRPEQLKFDFALWTRDAVRQLIKQIAGFDMPIRTVGEYLKRWGFTPQKPLKYAYERNPELVKKWMNETFPAIRKHAKAEKAEIYWGDETALQANDVRGRGFAPRGDTPILNTTAKYENLSMISAITNQGLVHWMIVDGTVNIEYFIEFLKSLIKYSRRKIYLVVDNLRVHHSKLVTEWVTAHNQRIALFFLPAYSPDLNPDEHLNSDLKQGVGSRAPGRTKNHLLSAAEDHLLMLKNSPERIRKYFKDPAIAYAAI